MENNLTDKQIEELSNTLSKNRENEDIKRLDEIQKELENIDNRNADLESGEGQYVTSGFIMESDSNKLDFNHFDNLDSDIDSIIEDNIKSNLSDKYNLSDDDTLSLLLLISKVRKNEKVNVYDNLPEVMKEKIKDMAKDENIPEANKHQFLNFAAEMLIKEFINDMELDAISIDFEKALSELVPTPSEMYSETNKEYIEEEFLKVAEKIKEESPIKAKNLLDMRQGFIDAYKLDPMYKLLNNSKVLKNIRRCDKTWKRIESDYLEIAKVCKFTLYPLKDLINSLITMGYSNQDSKRIITLFVYTYIDGIDDSKDESQYNDIYRNSFANYFESNIRNLAISPNLVSDFSKEIKDNINKLSIAINNNISIKEAELSNKKHKKRG